MFLTEVAPFAIPSMFSPSFFIISLQSRVFLTHTRNQNLIKMENPNSPPPATKNCDASGSHISDEASLPSSPPSPVSVPPSPAKDEKKVVFDGGYLENDPEPTHPAENQVPDPMQFDEDEDDEEEDEEAPFEEDWSDHSYFPPSFLNFDGESGSDSSSSDGSVMSLDTWERFYGSL